MIQGIEAANLDEVRELVAAGGYKDGRGDRLSGLAGPVCYPQTKVLLYIKGAWLRGQPKQNSYVSLKSESVPPWQRATRSG